MRVGIYDRYWSTLGGGERYASTLAEALKDYAEVDLIGIEPMDLSVLARRLDVDLKGVRYVRWAPLACASLVPLTRPYDLFINATYGSSMRSQARRSAYLVMFPHELRSRPFASVQRAFRSTVRTLAPWQMRFIGGHYLPEPSGVCWTGPDAWLLLSPRAFRDGTATIPLRTTPIKPRILEVTGPIASWSVGPSGLTVRVDSRPTRAIEIHIRSEGVVPRDAGIGDDERLLGICVDLGGNRGPLARLGRNAGLTKSGRDFLDDYDTLLAISEYTQEWTRRRWGSESVLAPPPVDTERFGSAPAAKKRVLLSVGRFFAASHHSKKHIEMLGAFREMCDRGLVPQGWEFHLAGRVHRETPQHVAYFEEVKRLARGYPIRILEDIPYDDLAKEYREAAIFWHATGWGEDDDLYPERFEHFGITTCEAMSAGCIPVVIDKAGQREIVTDGVNGYTFLTSRELIDKTASLMAGFGSNRTADLTRAAFESAARYGKQTFIDRIRRVLLP